MIENSLSRIQWTFRVLLLATLGTWLLSTKVWMTDRNFPVIPLFEGIPNIPSPIDYIFYSVLIVLAIYQVIYLENKNTKIALIALFAFLMMGDQMRWQPYNVQYFIMVVGLLFYPTHTDKLLNVFRLIIITFFIWSGFQELNTVFTDSIFPWLALPLAEKLPFKMEPYVINGGFAFAILNILAGVGLLFKKSRNIAVWIAIVIQLFLFYALSPMGNDWNHVILPYNIAMVFFCYLLFYDAKFQWKEIFWDKKFYYHQAIIVFFTILPFLSIAGLYDRMQSFNIYSGKAWYAKIYVTEKLVDKLPDGIKRYVYRPADGDPYIETTYWSIDALEVSPYSEKRVYNHMYTYICSFSEGDCPARLEIYTYADSKR
jgi:hypothetical protein